MNNVYRLYNSMYNSSKIDPTYSSKTDVKFQEIVTK